MKKILILSLFVLLGCQDTNSNSYDKDKYSELGDGSAEFNAALSVLKTRCISCHYHGAWATYNTSDKWVSNGLVVAKKADKSPVIYKIINFGGGSSNMPVGGSAGISGSE